MGQVIKLGAQGKKELATIIFHRVQEWHADR